MLAASLGRWLRRTGQVDHLEVLASGGPLATELLEGPDGAHEVVVVLDDHEPWDAAALVPRAAAALRSRLARLPPADANLLVSVAAGQVLPLLGDVGPIVTWSVEVGEDLHWLDEPVETAGPHAPLAGRLLGHRGRARARLGPAVPVTIVPEFVALPARPGRRGSPPSVSSVPGRATWWWSAPASPPGARVSTCSRRSPPPIVASAAGRPRSPGSGARTTRCSARWPRQADRAPLDHLHVRPGVPDMDRVAGRRRRPRARAPLGQAFPLICLHAAGAGTPGGRLPGRGRHRRDVRSPRLRGAPFPDVDGFSPRALDRVDRQGGLGRARCPPGGRRRRRFVPEVAGPELVAAVATRSGAS